MNETGKLRSVGTLGGRDAGSAWIASEVSSPKSICAALSGLQSQASGFAGGLRLVVARSVLPRLRDAGASAGQRARSRGTDDSMSRRSSRDCGIKMSKNQTKRGARPFPGPPPAVSTRFACSRPKACRRAPTPKGSPERGDRRPESGISHLAGRGSIRPDQGDQSKKSGMRKRDGRKKAQETQGRRRIGRVMG